MFSYVYGLSFGSITSVLSHAIFFHGEDIVAALKGLTKLDIHARLMRSYKKVPLWWWLSIIVVVLAMAIAMTKVFDTGLPVYGIFLAFFIPAVYMVPVGMINAVSNGTFSLFYLIFGSLQCRMYVPTLSANPFLVFQSTQTN